MSEKTKVYVTKYALTQGIQEVDLLKRDNDGVVNVAWPGAPNNRALFWPKDWSETREQAAARADEMRKAKIASIQKQIAKLEAMTF